MTWTGTISDDECDVLVEALLVAREDAGHYCEYGADDKNFEEYMRLAKLFTDPAKWAERGIA